MRFSAARLVTAAVLLGLLVAGLPAPTAGQSDEAAMAMHVALEPDGDARWTVSARYSLADEDEIAAFDQLADEYVTGQNDVLSADPYRTAAAQASEATGREMAINGTDRATDRDNATGELRLSFTWTNFARQADGGERLVLGDAFATPSDTWLPGLDENQELVIEFPDGFVIDSVSRGLDNRSIRVTGPTTFAPGEPSATLERGDDTSPGGTPSNELVSPSALSIGAAVAILLVVGYLVYRRQEPLGDASPDDGSRPVMVDAQRDVELLSDEERVLRLLQAEGGRMKQVDIVDETDWSNAKVSQLLSGMAEADRIEKLRIGRENLISLPDESDE